MGGARRRRAARAGVIAGGVARGVLRFAWRAGGLGVRGSHVPVAQLAGHELAETLVRLGPSFVKIGQILATRADLLPAAVTDPLQRLYDDMPHVPAGTLEATLRTELGVELHDVFASVQREPVASASVATVYRAWLHDGAPVAIKVLRPGVAEVVRSDLQLLRSLAGAAERLPGARLLPLCAMVDEVGICLERQLDLRREAAANRRLRAVLAHEPGITIPALVDHCCSTSILTMAFVPAAETAAADDVNESLLVVLRALYRMIFVEGFVHCDLHPGNLRLYPDGNAALMDLGFMAELSVTDRLAFARFFYAMATGDGPTCSDVALETAADVRPGLDRDAFEAEMTAIVDSVAGRPASEFSVALFVARLFDLMRRHGVRGTTGFTMAIVALLVIEGLAKDAGVDLDFQAEARPYLFRASLSAAPRAAMTDADVDALMQAKLVDMPVPSSVQDERAYG